MGVNAPDVHVAIDALIIEADLMHDERAVRAQIGAAVAQATSAWATRYGSSAEGCASREALQSGVTRAVGHAVSKLGGGR
jgi:hypothetical protein